MPDSLFNILISESKISDTAAAFNWKKVWYSRFEVMQFVVNLGEVFKQKNTEAEDYIFFYGGNHPVSLLMPFVASYLGSTYVPIPNSTSIELALSLAKIYKPKIFISDQDLKSEKDNVLSAESLWQEVKVKTKITNYDLLGTKQASVEMKMAFLTSGSTGNPKLILLNEQHLIANIKASIHGQNLTTVDTVLATLNICHSGGLCIQVLPALIAGSKIVLLDKFNVKNFLEAAHKFDCTVTLIVPSYLKLFKLSTFWNKEIFKKFRLVGIGSSKVDSKLAFECFQLKIPLLNIYGSTEAGPFAIYGWANQEFDQSVKIGKPAYGIEVKLSDENQGKIFLRGAAVKPQQLINGQQTSLIDQEGWFDTGDIGLLKNEELYFLSRCSDLLNIGGLKVNALDVEQKLNSIPGIKASAVVTRNHSVFNEILVAYIQPSGEQEITKRQIIQYCKKCLSRHMVPRNIFFISEFPRSSIGKILKNELNKKFVKS